MTADSSTEMLLPLPLALAYRVDDLVPCAMFLEAHLDSVYRDIEELPLSQGQQELLGVFCNAR